MLLTQVEHEVGRDAADTGSTSWYGKGFFSHSRLSVRPFYGVCATPVCKFCVHSHLCTHLKSQALAALPLFGHTKHSTHHVICRR